MKKIKDFIIGILGVSFGIYIAVLVTQFFWGLLNMQSCSFDLPKNATCEQIAENNVKNCSYIILRWKKNDYNKELKACRELSK